MKTITKALFVFGYPVSIFLITRWVPIVRQRRFRQFALHEAAVAAIVAGWAIEGNGSSIAINGSWLLSSTAWYLWGGRRAARGAKGS